MKKLLIILLLANLTSSTYGSSYLKAQVGQDFVRKFQQHWFSGSNKPNYMGGKVTSSTMFGVSIGRMFKENCRFDISVQRRDFRYSSALNAALLSGCANDSINRQNQHIRSYTTSLNVHYHVGSWKYNLFSPYFTAGVIYAQNKSQDLSSTTTAGPSKIVFNNPGKTTHNLGYAFGGGAWIHLTPNSYIEISYNYTDFGVTGANPATIVNTSASPQLPIVVVPSKQKVRAHELAIGFVITP